MTSFKLIGEILDLKLPPSSREAIHALVQECVQEREKVSIDRFGILFPYFSKDCGYTAPSEMQLSLG